jgi:UDP-2,3-diacylglucosamine hydrolase
MTKIYFASDFHLGTPSWEKAKHREKLVIQWLSEVVDQPDTKALYLVGDLFDFWFEYKTVVPKGYVRFLGKLAELSDKGIELHIFRGNHDTWMFDYLEKELGAKVYKDPIQIQLGEKNFMIGHGDGLGPGDRSYKIMKKFFRNPFCQWLFRWLHPDLGAALAMYFSRKSRASQKDETEHFLGKDKEWLLLYVEEKIKQEPEIDYFIFGHRHLAQDLRLSNQHSRYLNLGEWFSAQTYAVFDHHKLQLWHFKAEGEDHLMQTQDYADLKTSKELA